MNNNKPVEKKFKLNKEATDLANVHLNTNNAVEAVASAASKKQTAKVEPTQTTRVHTSVMQKVELIRLYSKTGMIDVGFTTQIEFISKHMDAICDEILKQVKK